jgi:hypothetical protein
VVNRLHECRKPHPTGNGPAHPLYLTEVFRKPRPMKIPAGTPYLGPRQTRASAITAKRRWSAGLSTLHAMACVDDHQPRKGHTRDQTRAHRHGRTSSCHAARAGCGSRLFHSGERRDSHTRKPERAGQGPGRSRVDLGGTYYNTKPQVEALETLLRKLPDPTTPAPPPVDRPEPGRARSSTPTKSRNSPLLTRPEQPRTSWAPSSGSNDGRSATSFTGTACRCTAAASPPAKWTPPSTSTTSVGRSHESANALCRSDHCAEPPPGMWHPHPRHPRAISILTYWRFAGAPSNSGTSNRSSLRWLL